MTSHTLTNQRFQPFLPLYGCPEESTDLAAHVTRALIGSLSNELGFPRFSVRLLSPTELHKMTGDDDLLAAMSMIVLVCSLVLRRRRAQQRKKRRVWVRPCWRYRDLEGQACTLLPRLRAKDEVFFRDFLRMTPSTFDTLAKLVGPVIERKETRFRKPISAHERPAITVRFLANGDSFRSLSFNFLIGRSTASNVVKDTCAAFWHILQPIYARLPQSQGKWKRGCLDVRKRLKAYFMTDGAVPWQDKIFTRAE
ncbi:hypothetical protein HPB48_021468 [Haemaphysalis longicornis]|uniref:Uncharacterized protein n=1 Tax=Haemaphysalis longicornis TaxID=44386 RepID=A0A9J6FW14_HAELO|nr:hypothetical protein HPB48_021468 [Haemaphysalis longicornis]